MPNYHDTRTAQAATAAADAAESARQGLQNHLDWHNQQAEAAHASLNDAAVRQLATAITQAAHDFAKTRLADAEAMTPYVESRVRYLESAIQSALESVLRYTEDQLNHAAAVCNEHHAQFLLQLTDWQPQPLTKLQNDAGTFALELVTMSARLDALTGGSPGVDLATEIAELRGLYSSCQNALDQLTATSPTPHKEAHP
jgi:uncharacterized protein YicC (UPF0701 family)